MPSAADAADMAACNRSYLYQLMQQLFGSEPTEALLDEVLSPRAECSLHLALGEQADVAIEQLCAMRSTFSAHQAAFTEAARCEYTRLFLGPNALPSPPWESVHTGSGGVLFGATTLTVRQCYARQGFRPRDYPHVADDHLAIELDFMVLLAQQSDEIQDGGRIQERACSLDCQRSFLVDHLLNWVETFAKKLQGNPANTFYPLAAQVLSLFLKNDLVTIDELQAFNESQKEGRS